VIIAKEDKLNIFRLGGVQMCTTDHKNTSATAAIMETTLVNVRYMPAGGPFSAMKLAATTAKNNKPRIKFAIAAQKPVFRLL